MCKRQRRALIDYQDVGADLNLLEGVQPTCLKRNALR